MAYVVGLAGPGFVGKSTTAKSVVASFNRYSNIKVTNYAFAYPIYEVASLLTGISIEELKDPKTKEIPWTKENAPLPCLVGWSKRDLLQKIGTECFRNNVDPNFWIQSALKKVEDFDIAIMEDARFNNEFEQCDLIIELERDGITYACNHPSAMPPDPKYVDHKVRLFENMDYTVIMNLILDKVPENIVSNFKCTNKFGKVGK